MTEYEWNIVFTVSGVDVSYTLTTDVNDPGVAIDYARKDIRLEAGIDVTGYDDVAAYVVSVRGYPDRPVSDENEEVKV